MYVALKKEYPYRGTAHPEGACIEVGDHLGGQMILNSIAKPTTKEKADAYKEDLQKKIKKERAERDEKRETYLTQLTEMKPKEIEKLCEDKQILGFKEMDANDKITKLMEIYDRGL